MPTHLLLCLSISSGSSPHPDAGSATSGKSVIPDRSCRDYKGAFSVSYTPHVDVDLAVLELSSEDCLSRGFILCIYDK